MSIQCATCGTKNREMAKFCRSCATPLTRTCPVCATQNPNMARFCYQCATPLGGTLSNPLLGTGLLAAQSVLANRYSIIKRVGQGGMGAVYKATDTRLGGKVVAVKEMSDGAITSELEKKQANQAFEQEAQILARLKHEYLPRVTDHFSDGGKQYLVMDFIDGDTLEQLLEQAQGPLEQEKVLAWGIQLCEVLAYLHSQEPPIIFRDLKPGNIMIDLSGRIKLIDFGIARFFKSGKATDTTTFGTVGYAPPEQYGRGQTDARSDLYALGATLHHLLTGHDPSDSPFSFAQMRSLNPKIAPAVEQAIMRALDSTPDKRWQSANDMRKALIASAAAKPAPAKPAPQPPQKPVSAAKPKVKVGTIKRQYPSAKPAKPAHAKSAPVKPARTPPPAPTTPAQMQQSAPTSVPPPADAKTAPARASNGAFLATVVVTVSISLVAEQLLPYNAFDGLFTISLWLIAISLWWMVGPLTYMLTRWPGAALLAYTLNFLGSTAVFNETPMANQRLSILIAGVVMEAVLAAGGYQNRRYWAVMLASVLSMLTIIIASFVIGNPSSFFIRVIAPLLVMIAFVTGSMAYVIGRLLRN